MPVWLIAGLLSLTAVAALIAACLYLPEFQKYMVAQRK
jgi:hypothetical protein